MEAAEYVGVRIRGTAYSVRTFYNLRSAGVMAAPDEIRRGRPRWRPATLDQWIREQIKTPSTEAAK